jgi:hypothetical protein
MPPGDWHLTGDPPHNCRYQAIKLIVGMMSAIAIYRQRRFDVSVSELSTIRPKLGRKQLRP